MGAIVPLRRVDAKFWKFSLDEMIAYDMPAIIEYVLRATKARTLGVVSFSLVGVARAR